MDGTRAARWLAPLGLLVFGAVLLAVQRPPWPMAVPVGAVVLLLAWWISPVRGGGISHQDVERRIRAYRDGTVDTETTDGTGADGSTAGASGTAGTANPGGPVAIYWRPGCQYCARLRLVLGRLRRQALWVNIWADADAAAFVRSVNRGNETVPTVRIGARTVWTNPPPDRVRTMLRHRTG